MVRNCVPPRMETTFYDEQSYHTNVNTMKRNMSLDLNPARVAMKKQQNVSPQTPDLKLLMSTPEMDKIMMNFACTPTTAHQILFPRAVTEEQESYARGFEEALSELHNSDSSQGGLQPVELGLTTTSTATSVSGGSATYTNLDQPFVALSGGYFENVTIKDEPQTVPSIGSTPPLSPIDMESQEKIKLERKRQRNRVAASKCRRRKLERISRLEDKVKHLKGDNGELIVVLNKLKEQVCLLKAQVMEHMEAGCQIVQTM